MASLFTDPALTMLDNARQLVYACAIVLLACNAASAMSANMYEGDVGHYRIKGDITAGGVWLLDPAGRQVDPPVFLATSDKDGLCGPPKYVVMQTHLLLIYRHADDKDGGDPPRCFAIRHSDYGVTGPVTYAELQKIADVNLDAYTWQTFTLPSTTPFVIVFVAILSFVASILVIAVILVVRRLKRRSRQGV